jgi:hypothetical protein
VWSALPTHAVSCHLCFESTICTINWDINETYETRRLKIQCGRFHGAIPALSSRLTKTTPTHSSPKSTGGRTKCHTIDCTHNTFLLLQKHLTSDTELILIGWKIVPNEEHVQCDHRFASQPLANEPLHSSQVCRCTDTGGTRPLLLQHRNIRFKLLATSVNCLFARSPSCTKVCTKTSLSL